MASDSVNTPSLAILIIVMGVSGTGKSTLAQALSKALTLKFCEADDYHSTEAKSLMSQGIALTDEQRKPWIERLSEALHAKLEQNHSCVLAYSGLKAAQRKQIYDIGFKTLTICLTGERDLIAKRLNNRAEHFMPASLLDSQFTAMQLPVKDQYNVFLDVKDSPEKLLEQALNFINGEQSR